MIRPLWRLTPSNEEASRSLRALISYYRDNASRMRYDESLRLGYGIGNGAVESAHQQVVHARTAASGYAPEWSRSPAPARLTVAAC